MRESRETLERLFDQTVYGTPLAESEGFQVDTSVKSDLLPTLRDAYVEVNRELLGETSVRPPRYVAAADVFYPEIGYLPVNGHLVPLPVGHAAAFYHNGTDSLVMDTIAIPGTPKNMWARNLYRNALNLVERLVDANPMVYGSLRRLKSFYSGVLGELSSWNRMKKTGVHEIIHSTLEKLGIAQYLTPAVNEGMTEAGTEEVTHGRSSLEGTTYDYYKNGVRAGIGRVAGSVKGFFQKYMQRGKSVIDNLYAQTEVRALPVAA